MAKLLRGRVMDGRGRHSSAVLKLDVSAVAAGGADAKLLAVENGDLVTVDQSVQASNVIHTNIADEIFQIPEATTLSAEDVFLIEESTLREKRRVSLSEILNSGVTLQIAYDGGGAAAGRVIDVSAHTASPILIQSDNVLAAWMMHMDWTVDGDLLGNPVGQVIVESDRTLSSGADGLSDNFVNFEITRRSRANLGGQTFSVDGAVFLTRLRGIQSAGTLNDATDIHQIIGPSGGTWTGAYSRWSIDGEANPVLQVNSDGSLSFGPGGGTALDASIQRSGGAELTVNTLLTIDADFDIAGEIEMNTQVVDINLLGAGGEFDVRPTALGGINVDEFGVTRIESLVPTNISMAGFPTGGWSSDCDPDAPDARDLGGSANWRNVNASNVIANYFTWAGYTETAVDLVMTSGSESFVVVTNTAVPRSVTLPAANSVTAGTPVVVKDGSNGAFTNNITVNAAGADTIDFGGNTTFVLDQNLQAVNLVSDGVSRWYSH